MKYYADVFRDDYNGKRRISIGCGALAPFAVQYTISMNGRDSDYNLFVETHSAQIDAIKQMYQDDPQGAERAIVRAFEDHLCDVIRDLVLAIEDAGGHIRPKADATEGKAENETRKPVWDGTKSLPLGCSLSKIKGTYHTKLIGTAVRRGEDGMPIEKICEVDCRHDLKQADVAYDGEHIGTVTLKSNDRRLLTRAGTGVLKAYLAKIAHSSRHRHFKAEAEEV